MLRVYQKLNSEGHKEYKEKQCIARVFLVSSVSISILNTIMGSLRYNIQVKNPVQFNNYRSLFLAFTGVFGVLEFTMDIIMLSCFITLIIFFYKLKRDDLEEKNEKFSRNSKVMFGILMFLIVAFVSESLILFLASIQLAFADIYTIPNYELAMEIVIYLIDPIVSTIQGITFCFLFLIQGQHLQKKVLQRKTKSNFQTLTMHEKRKKKNTSSLEYLDGAVSNYSSSFTRDFQAPKDTNIITLKQ